MNQNRINEKKWIKLFLLFSLLNMALLMSINYIIDPFNIFHSKFLKHQFQMNERFVKIEFLERHHHEFNAYLFGSSRIGTTKPSTIEQYLPNSKFYNFTLSSANLYDYLIHLQYFIKKEYPLNTLYLQIDIDNMMYYGQSSSDYLSKAHPYVLKESLPLYYLQYLIGFFPFNSEEKIKLNLNYTKEVSYNLKNGTWSEEQKELALSTDCQKYIESVEEFKNQYTPVLKYRKVKENISALRKIVKLCHKNNIKLYVFTTPHNHNMMNTFYKDDYLKFLKDIAKITNFYDFSGYNSITTNNCNYYETSHYRPLVAKLIAGRIFHDHNLSIPEDFGHFIEKK